MVYNYFAYIICLIWLYYKVVYPSYAQKWPLWLLIIICCLPVISGLSVVDYFSSLFAEPSVLLVLLLMTSCLPMVMPTKFMSDKWKQKLACNNNTYSLTPFDKKVWGWVAVSSTLIVFNALGLLPFDIYQLIDTPQYFLLNYVVFLIFFVVAIKLDTRFLIIAWLTLIAYIFDVMESKHILNYIADFWLFLGAVCMLISFVIKALLHRIKPLIPKKASS